MIYNNLLYFLTAIFVFSLASETGGASTPGALALAGILVLFLLFDQLIARLFKGVNTSTTAGYFKAEKRSAILALLFFGVMIFGLDLKLHISLLSLGGKIPALVNIAGLCIFLLFFVLLWRRARSSYERVFARKYTASRFILSNLKANLPIVIPWMILTLCYDLVNQLPWQWLQNIYQSTWGDVLFFVTFLVFIFIFFPPLVRRLWGCTRLEEGPLRNHLLEFCRRQNFTAELYIWPLFEGRVITAGVMGIFPGLRYILITPALLETMTVEELDSVMTHEIGHVKRFHLPLYVLLIGAFVLSMGILAEPIFFTFFSMDYFYSFIEFSGFSPEILRNIIIAVPSLVLLLIFFRFIFGFFMRNFERQADLHVFPVLGNSRAIISAFEKIAILSGNIRNQPSWHHFGIGERVDFLKRCEREPGIIRSHHRKVAMSLVAFFITITLTLSTALQYEADQAMHIYEEKFTRAELLHDANQEENPAHWLFFAGNFLLEHKEEKRAAIAFDLAMERAPGQPDLLNNYSWLLLTSTRIELRNPPRALSMARSAALLKPSGYILDTLATAWWANGFTDEAIRTAREAINADPEKLGYYQSQIKRFQSTSYHDELEGSIGDEGKDSLEESGNAIFRST